MIGKQTADGTNNLSYHEKQRTIQPTDQARTCKEGRRLLMITQCFCSRMPKFFESVFCLTTVNTQHGVLQATRTAGWTSPSKDKSNGIHRSFSHIWAPIWSLSFISSSVILLSYSEDDSPHPLRRFSQQWRLNHQGTEVQSPYNYHGTALWFPMPTTFYDQFAFLETQRNWEHTSWLWIVFSHVPSPKTNYRRKSRVAPFANKSYNNKSHSAVPLTRPDMASPSGSPQVDSTGSPKHPCTWGYLFKFCNQQTKHLREYQAHQTGETNYEVDTFGDIVTVNAFTRSNVWLCVETPSCLWKCCGTDKS